MKKQIPGSFDDFAFWLAGESSLLASSFLSSVPWLVSITAPRQLKVTRGLGKK